MSSLSTANDPCLFGPSLRASRAAGQPISNLMSRALANPDLISLAAGFVDSHTLPVEPTRRALETLFADPNRARPALQYGTNQGLPQLRQQLRDELVEVDDIDPATLDIPQVVITAGSNQLLHLIADCLLDPGDIVLCAAPTYLVMLGIVQTVGGRAISVATDQDGMQAEALDETLRQIEFSGELSRVKAVYLVPYFDNPRGLTMPLDRRVQVMDVVARWALRQRLYLIEDAAYRPLRYEGDDIPSFRSLDELGETVIVAGTFSKPFSPGIRIGWGMLPPSLVDPICDLKGNLDFGSPNLNQHLMATVLEAGLFEPHVQSICASYDVKRTAMLNAADKYLSALPGVRWTRPQGGLYVWAELPSHIDAGPGGTLFDRAIDEGMFYVPGEYCFAAEGTPVRTNTVRLSFGVQSANHIDRGMQAFARAIQAVLG